MKTKSYNYYNNSDKFAQLLWDLIDEHGASETCRALLFAGGNAGHKYTGYEGMDWRDCFDSNLFSIAYNATDILNPEVAGTSELYNKIKRNKVFTRLEDTADNLSGDRLKALLKKDD
jgi:hypothetical protein